MDEIVAHNKAEEVEKLISIQKAEGLSVTKDDLTFYVMQVYGGYYPALLSGLAAGGGFSQKHTEKPIDKKSETDLTKTEM